MEVERRGNCGNATVTAETTKKLRLWVDTLYGYHQFHDGQDGFAALFNLRKFVDELEGNIAPYGYCPHCSLPGVQRERRMNGNDTCENGHVYPSTVARK